MNSLILEDEVLYQGDGARGSDAMTETQKDLPDAALRALAEAETRREAAETAAKAMPKELGGRDGPEPVRYGDWERKGIAVDF